MVLFSVINLNGYHRTFGIFMGLYCLTSWKKDEIYVARSLPSWRTLQPTDGQELNRTVCSEEEMRALNSKEAVILITNLSSDEAFIPQHEIITDVTQMRTVANVHESLVIKLLLSVYVDFPSLLAA